MSDGDLNEVLRRAQENDASAQQELVERLGPRVKRVVRRHLNPALRRRYDSADFEQGVWASFFARLHRYTGTRTSESELKRRLAAMARNKTVDGVREQLIADKRDLRREISLEATAEDKLPPKMNDTPSRHAVAHETLEALLNELPEQQRQALLLRLQGMTIESIAAEIGVNERTIRRILKRAGRRRTA